MPQERADLAAVLARAAPRADAPGVLPVCFRCGASGQEPCKALNDPANQVGPRTADACGACGTRYVRSALTYESLPLLEFCLAPGISDIQVCCWCPTWGPCMEPPAR